MIKRNCLKCNVVFQRKGDLGKFCSLKCSNAKYIPSWIHEDPQYIKSCIRGLFDTEGSISFKIYKSKIGLRLYKQLNFRNANMILMRFIRDNLASMQFSPTRTLRRSLYLSNHKDIDRFRRSIGFSNPKLYKRCLIKTYDQYINL